MTKFVLDESLRARLLTITEPLELYDESGEAFARVVPMSDLSKLEGEEPRLGAEELQGREQEPDYRTEAVLEFEP